jgi:D-alanyl-D-alanine carboxypeptidase
MRSSVAMETANRDMSLGLRFGIWAAGMAAFVCCLIATSPAVAAAEGPARITVKSAAGKAGATVKSRRKARVIAARPSLAQKQGLRGVDDPLDLKSSVALVMDQDTDEVLFSKNADAVLPIASITKLMTAMVVLDAEQPMDETIKVEKVVLDTPRNNHSRLRVGTELSRGELMHLALMASENRAAYAIGAAYPGGMPALIEAMNRKARELGMRIRPRARRVGVGRPAQGAVPQYQFAGAQSVVGNRPAEDRLHLRGGPLRGDASAARRPQADHGAA